ncbi:MAG: flagellar hook-basal body complex protein, partial [Planctomycetota bacterium]
NGLLRSLGRIPVAMFSNNAGLEEQGNNLFRPTPNSGIPVVVTATTGGSGRLIGQTVELSNVDLAEEFINLITASTGFSASSRVLSTSDQLIQELLATIR